MILTIFLFINQFILIIYLYLDIQAMKFGQLIKYSVKNIFLQKSCRRLGRETSSRPLTVSAKCFQKVKAGCHNFISNIF